MQEPPFLISAMEAIGAMVIRVTPHILLHEGELDYNFVRSSGPGEQHVNKAATAVQLRFDAAHSPSLPQAVRERLLNLAGNRLTQEGEIIIEANQHRSQHRNRKEAKRRLIKLIRQAAKKPKPRKETQPPKSADEKRLQDKQHRSRTKELRKPPREYRY
jgi:ribosome-associated protein